MTRIVDLADVVAAAGLSTTVVSGWETRGRSGDGGQYLSGRPDWIMCHHTASDTTAQNDVGYIVSGAEYAPLANLYLARDARVWVLAAGPTNTNGKGGPFPGVNADDMNRHAIGIEAANNGTGEAWPRVQTDAYVALVAALADAYDIATACVASHAEWSPGRKGDPGGPSPWTTGAGTPGWPAEIWDMDRFRSSVDAARSGTTPPPDPDPVVPPTPTPTPEDDDIMNLYAARGKDGTIWVGNGTERTAVHTMDEWGWRVFCSNLGCGPRLVALYGNGATITDPGQINTMAYDAYQLDALGTKR